MDNRTLRSWFNKEGATESQIKLLYKLYDVILLWGAFDGGYWKIKDIARELKITTNTVYSRLKLFKEHFPEGYAKAKEYRACAKNTSERHYESSRRPKSWDQLKEEHGDMADEWIKEKF